MVENLQKNRKSKIFFLKLGLIVSLLIISLIILLLVIFIIYSYLAFFLPVPFPQYLILILTITTISILGIIIVISIREYQNKLSRRTLNIRNPYLTLQTIFENENRIKIITEILHNPGIHYSELLRSCNLQKGQLQWHLDVLLNNQIIKSVKQGQYTLFYPNIPSNAPLNESDLVLMKSKTSRAILDLIRYQPGISSTEIAQKLDVAKNTVKYHIDKLLDLNLISSQQNGRKKELYPQSEFD